MRRRTFLQACLALAALTLGGVAVQGCAHRSGHVVSASDPTANLVVTNLSTRSVHVYVDRIEIGLVAPGASQYYHVLSGIRPVHLRERGESVLTYYGDFNFFSGHLIGITYEPGVTHNLTVDNRSSRTLHVHVDLLEVGDVPPLEQGDFLITPGRHQVHFRESGQSALDYVGTFDFPALADDQEILLIYQP